MNITLKRKVAIASIIATSLLSVVSSASAASPTISTPKQLIAFTIPKQQQPEASVNNGHLQDTIPVSFLDIPIDYIVNVSGWQYKNTGVRRQLLVKQRHRDHEMFIVGTGDCRFMRYTRIRGLNPHSAPLNWHLRCSIG
jgi:hypothetical protein